MKFYLLSVLLSVVLALLIVLPACGQKKQYNNAHEKLIAEHDVETSLDSFFYASGYNIASEIRNYVEQNGIKEGYNSTMLLKGFIDGHHKVVDIFADAAAAREFTQKKVNQINQVMTAKALEKEKAFFEENKTKEGVQELEGGKGIQYIVLKKGTGAQPTLKDEVECHYVGTLTNGKEFDSSVKRGEPAKFPLNGVIQGWQIALAQMKEGDKWKIFIPSELGYGARGAGGNIPPNSTLIFEVELIKVHKK